MGQRRHRDRGSIATLLGRLRRTRVGAIGAALFGRRVVVRGASMCPLLQPGDRVLFERPVFWDREPARWEVVLAAPPGSAVARQVKLLAGLPGERVSVARDRLWVDGQPVALPWPVVGSLPGSWQLGPDEYFLLSYSVAVGTDSRHFGPVPRAAILGRARSVYWPPERRRRLAPLALGLEPAGESGPTP